VRVVDMGYVDCGAAEYNDHAGNANVLVFRDDVWPHPEGGDNVALTTVTYDLDSGQIYDADIEVNTAQYDVTTGDTDAQYDLLGVLTHEAGHFLGLGHSPDEEATMYALITPGDLGFRSLGDDDLSGICTIFPPGKAPVPASCNPIPRHGFASECATEQPAATCAASPAPPSHRQGVAFAGLAVAALAVIAARRRSVLKARSARRGGAGCPTG
jgi:MYXO-CTERM domain-containing protein